MRKHLLVFFTIFGSLLLISGTIDLNDLFNYANQPIPDYIDEDKDNTPNNNQPNDRRATLGRVLFYDKNLSANNTIACASCHIQEFAFGDTATLSVGLNGGLTGRHAMRLVNARFADEDDFFWDERANSLEQQTTMPIQDHVEMGFSGGDGDPGFDSLITKLEGVEYYPELFEFVFGSPTINEIRIQRALAQFVRSIQSFDSKYDEGRAQVNNPNAPFPNFTQQENMGKMLFQAPPPNGGAGCQACHRAPEFDIAPNSNNNGVITTTLHPDSVDLENTRSPSLRDMFNPDGVLNGPLMHDGSFATLMEVIDHYNDIDFDPDINPDLDNRLRGGPGGNGQNLNLSQEEKEALVAFLGTLTGSDMYTNEKWSDPFDEDGNLTIIPFCAPSLNTLNISICDGDEFEGYSETGTYEDIFVSATGCDSIRTLNLDVKPTYEFEVVAEICEGDDFEGYTEAGVYTDVFTTVDGCDSTRTLGLFVLPADHPDCLVDSVEEELAELGVSISPNPFKDFLNIQCNCSTEVEVAIFSLTGQKVATHFMGFSNGSLQLPTYDLHSGIYIVNVYDLEGQKQYSQKMIKVN